MPRLIVPLINANQLAILRYVQIVERALFPSTASAQKMLVLRLNAQLLTVMELMRQIEPVGNALEPPSCTRVGAMNIQTLLVQRCARLQLKVNAQKLLLQRSTSSHQTLTTLTSLLSRAPTKHLWYLPVISSTRVLPIA